MKIEKLDGAIELLMKHKQELFCFLEDFRTAGNGLPENKALVLATSLIGGIEVILDQNHSDNLKIKKIQWAINNYRNIRFSPSRPRCKICDKDVLPIDEDIQDGEIVHRECKR